MRPFRKIYAFQTQDAVVAPFNTRRKINGASRSIKYSKIVLQIFNMLCKKIMSMCYVDILNGWIVVAIVVVVGGGGATTTYYKTIIVLFFMKKYYYW